MIEYVTPKIGCWYRVNGRVWYCIGYKETFWKDHTVVNMECIRPHDYAAYITHHVIGENTPPYRTVAEMMSIPMPTPAAVSFLSTEKLEEISARDAFSVENEEHDLLRDANTKAGER